MTSKFIICVNDFNKNEAALTIRSLSNYSNRDILIATNSLPDNISLLLDCIDNKYEILKFKQITNEGGLLIKAIQRLFDSSTADLVYIKAGCLIRSNKVDDLITTSISSCLISGVYDYTYRDYDRWKVPYSREDIKFHIKEKLFDCNYIDCSVLKISLFNIRRSNISIDDMYDRYWNFEYRVDLGLDEFINSEFKKYPIATMPRFYNFFGDKYLVNIKQYNKSIRVNDMFIKDSIICNFNSVKPWSKDLKFSRDTLQFPVNIYKDIAEDCCDVIDDSFKTNILNNAKKWSIYLGNMPKAFTKYFGG